MRLLIGQETLDTFEVPDPRRVREAHLKVRLYLWISYDARSKRSRFITLVHAAAKSLTNFSFESLEAYTSE
jgi:hypothetical protein